MVLSSAEKQPQIPTSTGICLIPGISIQNGNAGPTFTSKLYLLKSHPSIVMPHEQHAINKPGNFVTVLYPTWFTSYLINSHNFLASGKKELIFSTFPDQGFTHIFVSMLHHTKKNTQMFIYPNLEMVIPDRVKRDTEQMRPWNNTFASNRKYVLQRTGGNVALDKRQPLLHTWLCSLIARKRDWPLEVLGSSKQNIYHVSKMSYFFLVLSEQ